METPKDMEARQANELTDYQRERSKRLTVIQETQSDLRRGTTITDPKVEAMFDKLLQDQRQGWEAAEKDEFDMLNHIHALEREKFFNKDASRDQLAQQIMQKSDRGKSQERS